MSSIVNSCNISSYYAISMPTYTNSLRALIVVNDVICLKIGTVDTSLYSEGVIQFSHYKTRPRNEYISAKNAM